MAMDTNNAVSASDTAGFVWFSAPHGSVWVKNDGTTNAVYIRVWQLTETPVTMTTTLAGAIMVKSGEAITLTWDKVYESGGVGYGGMSYICGAGLTTTFRYVAK